MFPLQTALNNLLLFGVIDTKGCLYMELIIIWFHGCVFSACIAPFVPLCLQLVSQSTVSAFPHHPIPYSLSRYGCTCTPATQHYTQQAEQHPEQVYWVAESDPSPSQIKVRVKMLSQCKKQRKIAYFEEQEQSAVDFPHPSLSIFSFNVACNYLLFCVLIC